VRVKLELREREEDCHYVNFFLDFFFVCFGV
jgi:hypothetical protein